jgi:hypothetical protein
MNGPPKKGAWGRAGGWPGKKDACPTQAEPGLDPARGQVQPPASLLASVGEPDRHREFDRRSGIDWHTHEGVVLFSACFGGFG